MKRFTFLLLLTIFTNLWGTDFCEEPAYENDFEEEIPDESAFWLKATWGFEGSSSLFDPDNISFKSGEMLLSLNKMGMTDEEGTFYPFSGSEIRTMYTFGYGRYEFKVKFSALKGLNESFFIAWDGGDYAEHHQFMGFQFGETSFSTLFSMGPDEDPANANHIPELDEETGEAKSIYKKSHTFAIEYTEKSVVWYYDGDPIRKQRGTVPDQLMNIIFRTWLPTPSESDLNPAKLPVETEYDYIKYYPTIELGCEKIFDTPQVEEPIVEELPAEESIEDKPVDEVIESCEEPIDNLALLKAKVESLQSDTVYLLGTAEDITELPSVFSSTIVVWIFENSTWKAYSPKRSVKLSLQSSGVEIIDKIPAHSGFWVQK